MNFILKALHDLGYAVDLIAIAPSADTSLTQLEIIPIDQKERHIYLPSFVFRVFGKNIIRGDLSLPHLKRYLKKHLTADDVVITYHSPIYRQLFSALKKEIHFRWIVQVEELYCMSSGVWLDPAKLPQEEKMFAGADGYLFVNDLLPQKYANGKPYAVSYGDYRFKGSRTRPLHPEGKTVVTYTGIVNEDRGLFALLDAMEYLDEQYTLRILGMGAPSDLERMKQRIQQLNKKAGWEQVQFCGTRTGQAYTQFLSDCHVGISLMNMDEEFSFNAFPSKIMSYLCHGLSVVTTPNRCIAESKVSNLLTYCAREPESIADAIRKAGRSDPELIRTQLESMTAEFEMNLKKVIEGDEECQAL